jgi:hypothetical protein
VSGTHNHSQRKKSWTAYRDVIEVVVDVVACELKRRCRPGLSVGAAAGDRRLLERVERAVGFGVAAARIATVSPAVAGAVRVWGSGDAGRPPRLFRPRAGGSSDSWPVLSPLGTAGCPCCC